MGLFIALASYWMTGTSGCCISKTRTSIRAVFPVIEQVNDIEAYKASCKTTPQALAVSATFIADPVPEKMALTISNRPDRSGISAGTEILCTGYQQSEQSKADTNPC